MKMPYRWYLAFAIEMYRRQVEQNRQAANIDADGSKSGLDIAAIRQLTKHQDEG
jgi:hypothetical protein